ncbi:hypothetical protein [Sphingobacterium lumbrici]|uniref:hypothetical protein n=1 Tax=Sphingobacterium lumbrici TaxID=2559600 RepID=UPI0015E48031|nr:hypothetical protein [Sphingobacterium lumbrici]
MTKKDFVVNCIQHMDIESLDLVFNANQILQETTKEIFLKKLNTVFAIFKKSGDTELIPYIGYCNAYGCTKEQGEGYSFEGNKSKKHFSILLFESKDGEVFIENCHDFELSDNTIEIKEIIKFYIYEDEKIDFIADPKYSATHTICSGALIQLQKHYTNTIIDKTIYTAWLDKFKLTHLSLNTYAYTHSYVFERFDNLYLGLKELANYLENDNSAKNALHEFEEIDIHNEEDLLKWLVKYEKTADNLVLFLEIHGDINPYKLEESSYFEIEFLKIDVTDFKNIIRFKILVDEYYWEMLDRYKTYDNNEESSNQRDLEITENSTSLSYHLNKRGFQL